MMVWENHEGRQALQGNEKESACVLVHFSLLTENRWTEGKRGEEESETAADGLC